MTKKTRKLIRELVDGAIPEVIHVVHWYDITQVESCKLGHPIDPIEFMSVGLIIEKTKKYIKLQQTWERKSEDLSSSESANVVLLIPLGAITEVYTYKFSRGK